MEAIKGNKIIKARDIEVLKWEMAAKYQLLKEDITDQEALEYLRDMSEAHGSTKDYMDWVNEAYLSHI